MNGLIFSIRRYSVHDGPGIRVTFFMKGCPLACGWCHNPEGISPVPEKINRTDKLGDMEFQRTEIAGNIYSVKDILRIIETERPFMEESGGGVTFSGGEPMMQPEFLAEALKACRNNGIHTAVDTSGYTTEKNLRSVIPDTNLFLFDIKHLDDSKHIEFTGISNKDIIQNYKLILNSGREVMVRVPVIPSFNDDNDHFERLAMFIKETQTPALKKINLLPFHKTGSSKYRSLNLPFLLQNIETPTSERMQEIQEIFMNTGIKVKIGG